MVCRRNYACFRCRYVNRGGSGCPHCGGTCVCMGSKWRMPARHKKREWEKLLEKLVEYNDYYREALAGVVVK